MAVAPPNTLFDEIIEFLTSTPSPEAILSFEPSETLTQQAHYLMEQNRNDALTTNERDQLDEFLRMNHFVNMLKIRARQKLQTS